MEFNCRQCWLLLSIPASGHREKMIMREGWLLSSTQTVCSCKLQQATWWMSRTVKCSICMNFCYLCHLLAIEWSVHMVSPRSMSEGMLRETAEPFFLREKDSMSVHSYYSDLRSLCQRLELKKHFLLLGQAKYIYSFASAPASHKMPPPQVNFRARYHLSTISCVLCRLWP